MNCVRHAGPKVLGGGHKAVGTHEERAFFTVEGPIEVAPDPKSRPAWFRRSGLAFTHRDQRFLPEVIPT